MPHLLSVNQTIRNAKRYAEIMRVLAHHGFGDIVTELKLDRLLERGFSLVGAGSLAPEFEHLPRQVRLRRAMEELGATFIKLGQVLSVRPDLIPAEWAREFRNLQDDCPQLEFETISEQLDAEFGSRRAALFKSVRHKPIAAGSMAQVHRAVLKDGTHIVLKVLRPGIEEQTETDIDIMHTLAHWAESHFEELGYSPTQVVEEFGRELSHEVDLTAEGRSTDRLRGAFEDDEDVVFPKVYWEATTRRILALEEIDGIILSRMEPDDLTAEERRQLVATGARAVMRQCLEIGFFHADPHPGNLIAMSEGRVGFIDVGMTGQIDGRTSEQLADLVMGVVNGDVDRVIQVAGALAEVDPVRLEDRAFRADARGFVAHFQNVPLAQLNIGALLQEFFDKLREHKMRCPADLVLLIKAITTIESVGEQLDPEFKMIEFAKPYVERLVARRYGVASLRRRIRNGLRNFAEMVEDLPGQVRSILTQVRRNRLSVNIEHHGLTRLNNTIEHASRNISFALIIAAMLVGSSILVLAARDPGVWVLLLLGIGGFVTAFILAILMVMSNRKLTRNDDDD